MWRGRGRSVPAIHVAPPIVVCEGADPLRCPALCICSPALTQASAKITAWSCSCTTCGEEFRGDVVQNSVQCDHGRPQARREAMFVSRVVSWDCAYRGCMAERPTFQTACVRNEPSCLTGCEAVVLHCLLEGVAQFLHPARGRAQRHTRRLDMDVYPCRTCCRPAGLCL